MQLLDFSVPEDANAVLRFLLDLLLPRINIESPALGGHLTNLEIL